MKSNVSIFGILMAAALILTTTLPVGAQDESGSPISIGADVMSRYVWRGTDYGASPSIQPYIEFGMGGFALGAWGAYTTNLPGMQEMDLYASYTFDDLVSVGIIDYFFPDETNGYDYFNWKEGETSHMLEGFISFNGLEDLPLSATLGYFFFNDDPNSLYLELGYDFSILNVFLGMGNGFYTVEDPGEDDKFSVVNAGISASKEITITENYGLPISASLITNPNAKQIHLVFGISF